MKISGAGLITALVLLIAVPSLFGAQPSHLDKANNPNGCSTCHAGHGKKGTPMLRAPIQDFCFSCHGVSLIRGNPRSDVYTVFNKKSRHPVFSTAQFHSPMEDLPEKNPATTRHVACPDCHRVHDLEPDKPYKGIRGHKRDGIKKKEAVDEYEICYNCHSDSANLSLTSKNKREEFNINNASYHPVEAAGRNSRVPSLKSPLNVGSRITCSDCHGNNDEFGAQGPHGSDFDYMLKEAYSMSETAEGPTAYELCYACHERQSIISNESFQKHKEHVVYQHIPCSACHNPHGVDGNPHLIAFDPRFSGSNMSTYMPSPVGRPICYLECHVGAKRVLHDNAFYWGSGTTKRWP